MKLAFVVKTLDSRGGGAERVLVQITSSLADRGHDVSLTSFGSADEPDFYPVSSRVKRRWLAAGQTQSRSTAAEVVTRIIRLRRVMNELNPDAAIGFMHSAYTPLALALATTTVPVVASEHTVYEHFSDRPLDRLVLRVTARLCTRITIISERVRQTFPGILARRMVVMPNPVTQAGRARPRQASNRRKVVLNVGRLGEEKDQETLICAFSKLAGKYPDWVLRILGEGPLRLRLVQLTDELGLADRIEFAGAVTDMAAEYNRAQILAMSSRYESFGLATAEALAHGVPAIGFADCPGTNELILDSVNGLLVPPGDRVIGLAGGLGRLMEDAELRRSLGEAGPQSVARFSLEAIVSQWEELLHRCAAQQCDG